MKNNVPLKEVVADFRARQRSLLPVDPARNRGLITPLSWKMTQDSPAQIAFAVLFLLIALGLFAVAWIRGLDSESVAAVLVGVGPLVLSTLLFRRIGRRHTASDEAIK